jgi:hypothetical protein
MHFGSPHIDTAILLVIDILSIFIGVIIVSIIAIFILKKSKEIDFLNIVKSNAILYLTLVFLIIVAFSTRTYLVYFSSKNNLGEKLMFLSFFVILFIFQSFCVFKFSTQKDNIVLKRYNIFAITVYLFCLIYVLVEYFPEPHW